jgi:cob(I)alamin adenosyltransferase
LNQDKLCPSLSERLGLITIFTGDGRGKTSAAIGTAVRATGHGLRVLLVFFMKGRMFTHGEMLALSSFPGITLASFGHKAWVKRGETDLGHREEALRAMAYSQESMLSGRYELVVLDEVLGAVDWGLITVEEVLSLLREKPAGVDLILTGRNAPPELTAMAEVVTEMQCVKHPYDRGIKARAGIDY